MREKLESLIDEMLTMGILFEDAVAEFEKQFILRVLDQHRGNISKAAQALSLHRNTLSKKLEQYRDKAVPAKTPRPRRAVKKRAASK